MHLKPVYTIQHVDFLRNIVNNYESNLKTGNDNGILLCGNKCSECFLNCIDIIAIDDKQLYELALDGLGRAGK